MYKIFASAVILILLKFQAWAEPSNIDYARANVECSRVVVEEVALYEFEWTDSLFEMKFTFIMHNNATNLDSYITDKIRLKNEFDIWRNHICFCAWDAKQKQVSGVACQDKRY